MWERRLCDRINAEPLWLALNSLGGFGSGFSASHQTAARRWGTSVDQHLTGRLGTRLEPFVLGPSGGLLHVG